MHFPRISVWLCAAVAGLSLAACSGVGNGSKPERLEISQSQALLGSSTNKSFVCFPEPLSLSIIFDNGRFDSGFATRATWTSSNPDVAQVSNGEILIPGSSTLAYNRGVVIPHKPGTTTITAAFSELSASYELVVENPSAFSIEPASLAMAKHTTSPINAKVVVDGYTRTVTSFGTWSFTDADEDTGGGTDADDDDDPSNIVQLITSSGAVTLSAGDTYGTRTAQVRFSCPEDSEVAALAEGLQAPVSVRELKTLTITPEFAADQPINVMTIGEDTINTTEILTTTAGFGDDVSETQDVTRQVTLQSSDNDTIVPVIGYVSALKAGTATVTASYPIIDANGDPVYDDVTPVTSAPVTITAGERTFKSLAISPADEQTIAPLANIQYHGIATFTDDTTQDVTRHVVWSTSDASIAVIGNGSSIQSGNAFSLRIPEDGSESVDITGTIGQDEAETKVTVPLKIEAGGGT